MCFGLESILKLTEVTIDLYYFKALYFFFKAIIKDDNCGEEVTELGRFYSEEFKMWGKSQ